MRRALLAEGGEAMGAEVALRFTCPVPRPAGEPDEGGTTERERGAGDPEPGVCEGQQQAR